MSSAVDQLRSLLASGSFLTMPCCYDALSAKLVEEAGFPLTFMSGFAVSASRLGAPDTGLISFGEMLDQGRNICQAVGIPVIGDGDTGYGNALNVRRTVFEYARAGFAAVMIEDQESPKRCGHTRGKQVIAREDAFQRIRACVDARRDGADILILARTDARATHGLEEAIARARGFAAVGADLLFVEAPQDEQEMRQICAAVPGVHVANMLVGGITPILPPERLAALGYRIAAYPLTRLSVAVRAMQRALALLGNGNVPAGDGQVDFVELQRIVGFAEYDQQFERYACHTGEQI